MAVVIHEFEVDIQQDNKAIEPASDTPPPAQPVGAQEFERVMRRQIERARRVWAH
jgi:hypothetical protein